MPAGDTRILGPFCGGSPRQVIACQSQLILLDLRFPALDFEKISAESE
jgi:hypothetical protein